MKLQQLQAQFADALFYRHDNIIEQIIEPESVTPIQRIQIYRNSFIMGTTEALAITYKHTLSLVGEEFFNVVSREFIITHPPTDNNIMTYGVNFNVFLNTLKQLDTMPYIAEMAKLEWLLEQTSNSQISDQTLDLTKLSLVAENAFNALQFIVPTQVCLFDSKQDVYQLYQMLINDAVVETDLNKTCYLALKKHADFRIELISLEKDTFLLLQQLLAGKSLGEIIPQELHEQLPSLLEKSLLNGFTISEKIIKELL
jgi:hypothetical protein